MIIFGGTRGIGNILATHYNSRGMNISISGRYAQTQKQHEQINFIQADISDENSVEMVFDLHMKKWGKNPSTIINCAAIQGAIGNSWENSTKKFAETLKINLLGSFIVAKIAIKRMMFADFGSIIMFSGGGATCARPNFSAYGVSKTGVLRMVETIAEELNIAGYHHIIINAIAPGAVKTDMTNEILNAGEKAGKQALDEATEVVKSGGTPAQEIINLVDFLIDKKLNKYLTGRLIHVREDYLKLVRENNKIKNEIGKIRRIPIGKL
jgi:NAD(P)-dependent dehydrogenase (short-subunit alcohol dehydrogenase family)